jgi:lipopolysaccharide biosynthesis protein
MSKSGAALDGPIIQKYPELLIGWKNLHDNSLPVAKISNVSSKIAIVVHIYYTETWAEIATILRRIDYEFDLIVTVSSSDKSVVAAIYRDFTNADVEIIENRGRDVRPFLVLLERGRFDRYRYVCKIHGKKSDDGGRMANLGAIWRNRMFFDLLAAPNALDSILNVFDRDPNIGMLGSAAYRYPSQLCSVALSWGKNRPLVLDIAEKMGIGADQFALDFFCGTMFWVRPETLRPLRELRLAGNFPDEMGKLDGGLEHAIERLFSAAVVASGFRIEGVDCVRLL